MRIGTRFVAVIWVLAAWSLPARAQQPVIAAIQVHGNTLTPDAEVVEASGLAVDTPFADALLESAAARLVATKRFQHVDVQKRYASIVDATQIIVSIRVDEGAVRIASGGVGGEAPHAARRSKIQLMFAPLFDVQDGYGVSYGMQVAVAGRSGIGSRVVFPLSWGGNKRAGAELQRDFTSRWAPRIRTGVLAQRRTHPFFRSDADRTRIWARGAWRLAKPLFAGATVAWQGATLLGQVNRTRSVGTDVILDTRRDPALPRNAIYAKASIDRVYFSDGPRLQTTLETIGYLGSYKGSIVVLRAVREGVNRSVPPFFKSVLGGADTLRGFRAGSAIGDTMVTASAELRIPLTSPLTIAKLGACAFIDEGVAYDDGQHLPDRHFSRGVGAGVWATAALFRINFTVAHGIGSGNRVHLDAGLTF
jgi:outer membrane protein assembly factor BamA